MINRINIRVYGLLVNEANEILLANEQVGDISFTKFPGGGLEFGEGVLDCLKREFMEECNLPIEIESHFYTTDFFQQSAFIKTDQFLPIYYKVIALSHPIKINLNPITLNLNNKIEIIQFKWVKMTDLKSEMLTFPIDKLVCSMLIG